MSTNFFSILDCVCPVREDLARVLGGRTQKLVWTILVALYFLKNFQTYSGRSGARSILCSLIVNVK